MAAVGTKKKSKQRGGNGNGILKEGFVPGPLSGTPDPDRPAAPPPPANDVLTGPPMDRAAAQMESGTAVRLDDLFPLPGETGGVEEWEKAFTLDGSRAPSLRPDHSVSVAGGPTLWRAAAARVPQPMAPATAVTETLASTRDDVSMRLDTLTRQLESLTTPSPIQGTAELFLFVAIGLLLLLAIDTLLRFAVSIGSSGSRKMVGGRRFVGVGRRFH